MKKIWILLVCAWLAYPVMAQESSKDAEFGQWMTYYYIHKDNSKVGEFLKRLQETQALEKRETARQPTAAFLSVLFKDNPGASEGWLKSAEFSGKTKETFDNALRLSGTNLLEMPLKQPGDLDMMWAAFSASGDDRYVKRIVDVLDENTVLTGDKAADTVTRASADWSLGSNMMQHELVNRLVRKEIGLRDGAVKKKLEDMVARNERDLKPFANRDGEFSAMLLVIDEKSLTEFAKPSTEGMTFKEVKKAKRGDILAIKLTFAGVQLSDELMADVTYDFKILDPDGKIYGGSDAKNLEALKGKMPSRYGVFDNRSFMKIRFEPDDKLGDYKIIAEIRDNIAHKKIPLTKTITLAE